MTEKANLKEVHAVKIVDDVDGKFAGYIELEKPIEHEGFLYCSYNLKHKSHKTMMVYREDGDPFIAVVDLPLAVMEQIEGEDYDLMDSAVEEVLTPNKKTLAAKKKKLVTLR